MSNRPAMDDDFRLESTNFSSMPKAASLISLAFFFVFGQQRSIADYDSCRRIYELAARAEELSGVKPTNSIRCLSLTIAGFNERAKSLESEAADARTLKAQSKLYKTLGIISDNYNYESCQTNNAADSNFAFYDRNAKQIVVRSDTSTPDNVLIHELIHAIRDSDGKLKTVRKKVTSSDSDLAVAALVEGEAVYFEEQFLRKAQRPPEQHETITKPNLTCQPPEPLYSLVLFPYEWGLRFIEALVKQGGLAAIESAYKAPPIHSSDILYPAKYITGYKASISGIKSRPGKYPGYHLLLRDSLGEATLRDLLKHFTNMQAGVIAAKGWQADQIELYENNSGDYLIEWQIQVETKQDLLELVTTLNAYLKSKFNIALRDNAPRLSFVDGSGLKIAVNSESNVAKLTISD